MRPARALVFLIAALALPATSIAQAYGEAISADNLRRLRPYAQIDFEALDAALAIGWFAANDDATEFVVFGRSGEVYDIYYSEELRQWRSRRERGARTIALIDGLRLPGETMILHQLDDQFYLNDYQLRSGHAAVALFQGLSADNLFVETVDDNGQTRFLHYTVDRETGALALQDVIPFPDRADDAPAIRLGRINFPVVIVSALAASALHVYRYPDSFDEAGAKAFQLVDGPAVLGAVNGLAASHLAWTNPARAHLSLLDLKTGEDRTVAALDGSYPQYLLLSNDASAILAVNLDFQPQVVAWNVESGARYDLGPYRECGRIPDHVELSRDGRALIIGCDTGLEIWRVID